MNIASDITTVEEMLLKEAEKSLSPINGSIELLPVCNMNCDMCYVRLSHEEVKKRGHIRSAEEWLNVAQQMKDTGVLFLLLTGGEPLLYPEFKKLYLALKDMGMIITINTNGTLIDEEWVSFFSKHKPRRINITVYGSTEDTYNRLCHYPQGYLKVMKAIQMLKENDVPVKMNISAVKMNINELSDIMDSGYAMDVPVEVSTYMMPSVRERSKSYNYDSRLSPEEAASARIISLRKEMGEENFQRYRTRTLQEIEHILPEEEPKHMNCLAGKCSFTINWQGEMRPCVIMTEPAMSVFEHSFLEAWEYIVKETGRITLNSKCCSCKLRPVCRTCAACALLEGGSYDALPEYMCRYAQASYEELLLQKDK